MNAQPHATTRRRLWTGVGLTGLAFASTGALAAPADAARSEDRIVARLIKKPTATRRALDAILRNYTLLPAAMSPDNMMTGNIERNIGGIIATASVTWPDGTPGTFTTLEINSRFGAIDSYEVTYGETATYTQPSVIRDEFGDIINRPQMRVS